MRKKLLIVDIDDCILHSDKSQIAIIKNVNGDVIRLSTEEFANDPDRKDESKFSMKEFRDPKKVFNSIVKATPLVENLKIMDRYLNEGYKLSVLTARGLEKTVLQAINKFLMYRDKKGHLHKIRTKFVPKASACVNDVKWTNFGANTPERKANVIRVLCKKYHDVAYMDDDTNNIKEAIKLHLPNLRVIQV